MRYHIRKHRKIFMLFYMRLLNGVIILTE